VLERVRLNDSLAIGEVGTPSASGFAHSGWPTVAWGREAAVQTAGLHAIVRHGIAALPAGCRRLEHFGEAPPGLMLRTEAYFRGVKGDEVEYDINLVGADGQVYDRMIGYRAVRLRTFP